jgi:hypothetical protein
MASTDIALRSETGQRAAERTATDLELFGELCLGGHALIGWIHTPTDAFTKYIGRLIGHRFGANYGS